MASNTQLFPIDSTFFKVVSEEHSKPFDWVTNNCGLFVANVYERLTGEDFSSDLRGEYTDELSAFRFIRSRGGWDKVLTERGFVKREDKRIMRGDVVIAEHALGIWVGNVGLFAGGASRSKEKVEAAYTYTGDR